MASAWRNDINRQPRDRRPKRPQPQEQRPVLQLPVASPNFEVDVPEAKPERREPRGVAVVDFYI